jgi:hypothetical protein
MIRVAFGPDYELILTTPPLISHAVGRMLRCYCRCLKIQAYLVERSIVIFQAHGDLAG